VPHQPPPTGASQETRHRQEDRAALRRLMRGSRPPGDMRRGAHSDVRRVSGSRCRDCSWAEFDLATPGGRQGTVRTAAHGNDGGTRRRARTGRCTIEACRSRIDRRSPSPRPPPSRSQLEAGATSTSCAAPLSSRSVASKDSGGGPPSASWTTCRTSAGGNVSRISCRATVIMRAGDGNRTRTGSSERAR
jgi:hypothetical protein